MLRGREKGPCAPGSGGPPAAPKGALVSWASEATIRPQPNPRKDWETLMKLLRSLLLGLASLSTILAVCDTASAQGNYPTQLVKFVVPFSAGSITDTLARILADKLSEKWKQQVIVENRPGLPGTTSVARAAPDGY